MTTPSAPGLPQHGNLHGALLRCPQVTTSTHPPPLALVLFVIRNHPDPSAYSVSLLSLLYSLFIYPPILPTPLDPLPSTLVARGWTRSLGPGRPPRHRKTNSLTLVVVVEAVEVAMKAKAKVERKVMTADGETAASSSRRGNINKPAD